MAIVLRLDRIMADRKISLTELSERVGISMANLSNLKTGKVKAIRFSTLDAICRELQCRPGDILEYQDIETQPQHRSPHFCAAAGFFQLLSCFMIFPTSLLL